MALDLWLISIEQKFWILWLLHKSILMFDSLTIQAIQEMHFQMAEQLFGGFYIDFFLSILIDVIVVCVEND
jgi:hypothetical protein